jgi:hypothetical protein
LRLVEGIDESLKLVTGHANAAPGLSPIVHGTGEFAQVSFARAGRMRK